MDNWMVHAFSSIFLITLYSVVSAARYQLPAGRNYETQDSSSFQHCSSTEGYVSYIQVENAAVNLTGMDMHGSYFTLTWKPIDHNKSWDDSSVISFIITYSQNNDRNKQTIVTLSNYNLNAYIVEDVKPEHIYIISMSVSHYNGPPLTSNTVILCTGTVPVVHSRIVGEALLVSALLICWMATICMCIRQVDRLGNSVTFKDRFINFRRRQPRNISRIRVVTNPKHTWINTDRLGPTAAAPIAEAEDFENQGASALLFDEGLGEIYEDLSSSRGKV